MRPALQTMLDFCTRQFLTPPLQVSTAGIRNVLNPLGRRLEYRLGSSFFSTTIFDFSRRAGSLSENRVAPPGIPSCAWPLRAISGLVVIDGVHRHGRLLALRARIASPKCAIPPNSRTGSQRLFYRRV
jgi:hypothetical protein